MNLIDIRALNLKGQRVLVREDFNVPVQAGKVMSDVRIRAALPSLEYVLNQGAKLMVMSHLGRPEEGKTMQAQAEMSLKPVAQCLEKLMNKQVKLVDDYLAGVEFAAEDFVLFENIRSNQGEKRNDPKLAQQLAALCDVFVMDAFGTAHRSHASTEGVARYAPIAAAGPLLITELQALEQALIRPNQPIVAVVGGSKVSTKLGVLEALSRKVDQMIVGGGIANTLLAAKGLEVGKSLFEPELIDSAKSLLAKANISLPTDLVTAKALQRPDSAMVKPATAVAVDDMVLDIGPESSANIAKMIRQAGTIIWNGPVGVFEQETFAAGTRTLALAIADNQGFSIAGGGDTLAAIDKFGIGSSVSYISTGGGAFLEFVEGKTLPAVAILQQRAKNQRYQPILKP